jgi:hypothetical protein
MHSVYELNKSTLKLNSKNEGFIKQKQARDTEESDALGNQEIRRESGLILHIDTTRHKELEYKILPHLNRNSE